MRYPSCVNTKSPAATSRSTSPTTIRTLENARASELLRRLGRLPPARSERTPPAILATPFCKGTGTTLATASTAVAPITESDSPSGSDTAVDSTGDAVGTTGTAAVGASPLGAKCRAGLASVGSAARTGPRGMSGADAALRKALVSPRSARSAAALGAARGSEARGAGAGTPPASSGANGSATWGAA